MGSGWGKKFLYLAMTVFLAALVAACGGGGGGSSTATVTGSASFPVAGNVMAKRVAAVATDAGVFVEAYSLDGKQVAQVNPTADTTLPENQRIYSYSIPGLKVNTDYVIKVRRGSQVLKKLIEKDSVVPGVVAGQTVDAITTAAVVVASQKLSTPEAPVVLGDPLPAGKTVGSVSATLVTIQPALIETSISAAVKGGRDALTDTSVSYANLYNMVVVAVSTPGVGSVDSVLSGGTAISVPLFNAEAPTAPAVFSNISSSSAGSIASSSGDAYVPPTNGAETAAMYVQQAKQYLAKQDIANANRCFELALAADSSSAEANIGGALTSGLMIMDDADFKAIAAKWEVVYPSVTQVMQGTSPVRLPFDNMTSLHFTGGQLTAAKRTAKTTALTTVASAPAAVKALAVIKELTALLPKQKTGFKSVAKELGLVPSTAPSVSEMQAMIDNVIIPRFDTIIARLQKAEAATNNSFTITAAMQGNPLYGQNVVLGTGEYYALDAALNAIQVLFKFSTAYSFDVPSGYTYDTIAQDPLAMINNSGVFVLKSDGKAKMAAGLDYARKATAKSILAFNEIKGRAYGVGAVDIATWTQTQKDDFTNALNNITTALAGPSTITIDGASIRVDLTKFFTNPLDRSNLPTFAYDLPRDPALSVKYMDPVSAEYASPWDPNYMEPVICDVYPTSDIPDYTLNGIFPDNTAANNIGDFNGILPMASGKALSAVLWQYPDRSTTDGTYVYVVDYNPQSGNPVIKKIDPATGAVSTFANGTEWPDHIFWHQGQLYAAGVNWVSGLYSFSVVPVNVSGGTFTYGQPVFTSPGDANWFYISAITSNGTDIYYTKQTWNDVTYQTTGEVRKVSNGADTSMGIFPTDTDMLGITSASLYSGHEKYDLTTKTLLASYVDMDFTALIGGYFYKVKNDRIIKFYGTPSKGLAKSLRFL
ncbi:hypothetical protein [Geomonas subterranea]|uniref:hypothetical protein n=1 Tax=Geomonas subterranea TaxID=2847989 RepID=UPI001CD38DA6|nr:hypothetical protein [Geomonas fuzhouensis]